MKVKVLGCSGGIGGRQLRTTSLLVDKDILIDAGTGVGDLPIPELLRIDHIFITHSHLDHVACLPLMLDSAFDIRPRPITVYALPEVIDILRHHIFNWLIWPDFSEIPSKEKPFLNFRPLAVGEEISLNGRKIKALPANHTVPAVAYELSTGKESMIFSGDTTSCEPLFEVISDNSQLKYLIVECAFSNREEALATDAKHFCPKTLATACQGLSKDCEVFITHLKPGQIEQTMLEIEGSLGEMRPRMLRNGQVFELAP